MKHLSTILPIILFVAIIAGVVYYLGIRFALFFPQLSKRTWLIILSVATVVLMGGGMMFSTTAHPVARTFYMISAMYAVTMLILTFSCLLGDIFFLLFKYSVGWRTGVSLGLGAFMLAYSIINAYSPRVIETTIEIPGLTKELTAVHLTDMHLGDFRGEGEVKRIYDKVKELNPDVIFNTGDLFDAKKHFEKGTVLDYIKDLGIPQYFTYGNHDQYVGVENSIKLMKGTGAIVLQNEVARFGELQIIGLSNMPVDDKTHDMHGMAFGDETIENTLQKLQIDSSLPTIAMHHRPEGAEYIQAAGADLLLSGHTHAGQFFPVTIINDFLFKYNKGLYKYKDMSIYVSQGTGTIFAPLRLGSVSEIALLHLVPAK